MGIHLEAIPPAYSEYLCRQVINIMTPYPYCATALFEL
jgi:hypothetical protein